LTLYEYHEPTNLNCQGGTTSTIRDGQSFTIGTTGDNKAFTLTSISWKGKLGPYAYSLPGTVYVDLYAADANGLPTGSILSSGTTDGDTWSTTMATRTVVISAYILRKSTKYVFTIRTEAAGQNYTYTGGSTGNAYTGGTRVHSTDSGSTWSTYDCDLWFQINGTVVACTDWTTESDCTDNGCYWYNGSCHSSIDCETINNQTECEAYDCHWYDDSCHGLPPDGPGEIPWLIPVAIVGVVIIGGAIAYMIKKPRKNNAI